MIFRLPFLPTVHSIALHLQYLESRYMPSITPANCSICLQRLPDCAACCVMADTMLFMSTELQTTGWSCLRLSGCATSPLLFSPSTTTTQRILSAHVYVHV